eukprot:scaffold2646_cov226-Pinguiococcus_pyrenoidosus.AAC.4
MEAFKECERETKTKTYSKAGLERGETLDPEEEAKQKTMDWVQVLPPLRQRLEKCWQDAAAPDVLSSWCVGKAGRVKHGTWRSGRAGGGDREAQCQPEEAEQRRRGHPGAALGAAADARAEHGAHVAAAGQWGAAAEQARGGERGH